MTGEARKTIDLDNWTTQLRKGLLELCIVTLLTRGEMYGYYLVKRLATITGLVVSEGTIYPVLSRLRRMGVVKTRLVESSSGPARRYYGLTPQGLDTLGKMNAYWDDLVEGEGREENLGTRIDEGELERFPLSRAPLGAAYPHARPSRLVPDHVEGQI